MATASRWTVWHYMPGRLRVTVPGLRANRPLAVYIQGILAKCDGIASVSACIDSGRILVRYDPIRLPLPIVGQILMAVLSAPGHHEVAAAAEPATAILPHPSAPEQSGLSAVEAARRLQSYGPNELQVAPRASFWQRLLDQFKDAMVVTLLAGAGISLAAGRLRDALTIAGILTLNAIVGATQAGKAEGSLDALRKMSAPQARVLRDGRPMAIAAAEVVPGDLIVLEAGDKVPADASIVGAFGAAADESLLTGESMPAAKVTADPDAPQGGGIGRPDMLFAGTTLTRGRCVAVVTATGMQTEMGRIARLLGQAKQGATPLQRRMEELGRTLVKGSLLICGGVVLLGLLRGQPLLEMFLTGVSLAVAAIPEGMPTFVTLALATGVRYMARKNAIVRKLQAVETLGSATIICTDKTGTLTANQMTVRQIYVGDRYFDVTGTGYAPKGEFLLAEKPVTPREHPDLVQLLGAGVLCNNAVVTQQPEGWVALGDTTEAALVTAARKAGIEPDRHHAKYRRVGEIPFESERRRMTVLCEGPKGNAVWTKGAPEAVLDLCTHINHRGKVAKLTAGGRKKILQAAEQMAGRALRVLAVACRPTVAREDDQVESAMVFLGLIGMMDPPRPEVGPAIERCRRAGVQVMILTGDHPRTAAAIAQEIGLLRPGDLQMTGAEVAQLNDRDLRRCIDRLRVCARMSPEQKLRIVRALRAQGHVVAMTGDGVNDAPSVREADIGIAMGRTGTEVTKAAAGLILADDNFATIVAAVEQGRVTYNNIRKSIRYLLASNIGELVLMAAAVALGLPLPLIPLQLLWLNLVGDGLPALALGAEPADGTEMSRPPRPAGESIFAAGLGGQIVRHGLWMGAAAMGLYVWALRVGKPLPVVRTLTLCALVLGQLLYMMRCRRRDRLIGRQTEERNPLAGWAIFGSLTLLLASVTIAPLRRMLQLTPLRLGDWGAAAAAAFVGNVALA